MYNQPNGANSVTDTTLILFEHKYLLFDLGAWKEHILIVRPV